jgi:hypothetical protein
MKLALCNEVLGDMPIDEPDGPATATYSAGDMRTLY